jgi:hypothetical protein
MTRQLVDETDEVLVMGCIWPADIIDTGSADSSPLMPWNGGLAVKSILQAPAPHHLCLVISSHLW